MKLEIKLYGIRCVCAFWDAKGYLSGLFYLYRREHQPENTACGWHTIGERFAIDGAGN